MNTVNDFLKNGFSTIDNIYSEEEVERILARINQADTDRDTFRKSGDLFAIRQFLKEIPAAAELIFNHYCPTKIVKGFDRTVAGSVFDDKIELFRK